MGWGKPKPQSPPRARRCDPASRMIVAAPSGGRHAAAIFRMPATHDRRHALDPDQR
jgi:hypothetical protein